MIFTDHLPWLAIGIDKTEHIFQDPGNGLEGLPAEMRRWGFKFENPSPEIRVFLRAHPSWNFATSEELSTFKYKRNETQIDLELTTHQNKKFVLQIDLKGLQFFVSEFEDKKLTRRESGDLKRSFKSSYNQWRKELNP